ncbi:RecT family recombinase [Bacillus sp. 1P02SD]|uniref:RecT family recombinase n=1 Tax=Bacillus sp. 1P02SD TaxID=3132264 RepID=UPI0039A12FE1
MSKNQLAPINTNEFENYFSQKELEVVVNSIAKNATNEELALFIQICKHNGLDPFKNHIYFVKYGNQMSIQVSVEGIQYLAQQREDYRGVTSQLVHENDDFEVEIDAETQELKITKHSIKFPRGKVAAAYAIARREGFPDKVVIIEAEEVEHLRNKQGSQWKTYYNDMFKKHALKRALKSQFGIDVDDQEQQQESYDGYEPRQRVDITPTQEVITVNDDGQTVDPEEEMKKHWDTIKAKQNTLGMSADELKTMIKDNFGTTAKKLSLQQVVGLSKLIDMYEPVTQDDLENMDFAFEDTQLD